MTFEEVMKSISTVGLPAVMLVLISWATIRVLRGWVRPMVDKVIDAHLSMIESLKTALKTFEETLRSIKSTLDEVSRRLERIENGKHRTRSGDD